MTAPLHTADDIALWLGIPREQVLRRCRTGEFSCIKVGREYRFDEQDWEAIKASHRRAPREQPANPWGVRPKRAS